MRWLLMVLMVIAASRGEAQMRAPYGSGTGVNSLGIKTNAAPRTTRSYTIRQPSYVGYGYPYGYGYNSYYDGYSYYGPGTVYGSGYVAPYRHRCHYCGHWGCDGSCRGPIYLPPVVLDPGLLYGPRANYRFFFGDPTPQVVVPNVVVANVPPAQAPAAQVPLAPAPAVDPLPNREARARAWRLIEAGDRNFKEANYRDALGHYRKAGELVPELAEAYFREAFALLALDRWTEATLTIERGLIRKPNWPQSGFVLDELYATPDAKREAFRTLQVAKRNSPNNSDVRFLLGVLLHFDGQPEAAEVEFRRVIEITGRGAHAQAFLPAAAAQPEPQAP